MMTISMETLAASNAAWAVLGAFLGGLVIAGALIWAVRLGIRVRRREPAPPRPSEQPKPPPGGPVMESREVREPNEVPRAEDESERLTPHELHSTGTKRSEGQQRPRWSGGSGGSFGSGGSGTT
ncbi:DUF6479 family protein [Streptomyces sp. NPDC047079]|uniref:DUF6479 family protein n=1 Tax=Streptomyces sp. NPDC047079 TaxID=3154607 RepID=UPI0033DE005C